MMVLWSEGLNLVKSIVKLRLSTKAKFWFPFSRSINVVDFGHHDELFLVQTSATVLLFGRRSTDAFFREAHNLTCSYPQQACQKSWNNSANFALCCDLPHLPFRTILLCDDELEAQREFMTLMEY